MPEPTYMSPEQIDALPVGTVVMTVTDPNQFGLYEQRVWEKFGGSRDWQFGVPRHEWQSTDGGFVRIAYPGGQFAFNRKVMILFQPDAATSEAIVKAHRDFVASSPRA